MVAGRVARRGNKVYTSEDDINVFLIHYAVSSKDHVKDTNGSDCAEVFNDINPESIPHFHEYHNIKPIPRKDPKQCENFANEIDQKACGNSMGLQYGQSSNPFLTQWCKYIAAENPNKTDEEVLEILIDSLK